MLAKNVARLPADDGRAGGVLFEPKWDGFRALAFHDAQGRVELQSRQCRLMTRQFPDIARLVREHTSPGTVLDGELVVWARGRTDFALLQRRLAAGPRKILDWASEFPAHLVVFDVLQVPPDLDVRAWPLTERRALLERLLVDAPPQLPLSLQSTSVEQAQLWLETLPTIGVEGVVIKGAAEPYRVGRRDWLKLRQRGSTEALVGGVTGTLAQPETVLLGRLDSGGVLRYVARTRPVTVAQRAELRDALHRAGAGRWAAPHPWPRPLPATWSVQLGHTRAAAVRPGRTRHGRGDRGRRRRRGRQLAHPTEAPADPDRHVAVRRAAGRPAAVTTRRNVATQRSLKEVPGWCRIWAAVFVVGVRGRP